MADPLVFTFHLIAPCKCPVARVQAVNEARAWAVLLGPDVADVKRTHQMKPVNHSTYESTARPYRGRCPHLENQP